MLINSDQVYTRGIKSVIEFEAIAKASRGTAAIYVNFDMDILESTLRPW